MKQLHQSKYKTGTKNEPNLTFLLVEMFPFRNYFSPFP
jgi:hypothetical protein